MPLFLTFITALFLSSHALAANPPDDTYVLLDTESMTNPGGSGIEWYRLSLRKGMTQLILSRNMGGIKLGRTTYIQGANPGVGPVLVGVDIGFHSLHFVHPNFVRTPPQKVVAICAATSTQVLVASLTDELSLVDENGIETPVMPSSWWPVKYGKIKQLQLIGSDRVAILAENYFVIAQRPADNSFTSLSVFKEFDLHSLSYLPVTGLAVSFKESKEFVSGEHATWISTDVKFPDGTHNPQHVLIDHASGKAIGWIQPTWSNRLLEIDPQTNDAFVAEGNEYFRYTPRGVATNEAPGIFWSQKIRADAKTTTNLRYVGLLHINHPRAAEPTYATPSLTPLPPTAKSATITAPAPVVAPPPRAVDVQDPRSPEDFIALLKLKVSVLDLPVEDFANAVNNLNSMRPRFYSLSDEVLKNLHLRKQGARIAPLLGHERVPISLHDVAAALSVARLQSLANCGTGLTNQVPD